MFFLLTAVVVVCGTTGSRKHIGWRCGNRCVSGRCLDNKRRIKVLVTALELNTLLCLVKVNVSQPTCLGKRVSMFYFSVRENGKIIR